MDEEKRRAREEFWLQVAWWAGSAAWAAAVLLSVRYSAAAFTGSRLVPPLRGSPLNHAVGFGLVEGALLFAAYLCMREVTRLERRRGLGSANVAASTAFPRFFLWMAAAEIALSGVIAVQRPLGLYPGHALDWRGGGLRFALTVPFIILAVRALVDLVRLCLERRQQNATPADPIE